MKLEVTRLDRDLPLPAYAQIDDAGLDLMSAEDVQLKPAERAAVPTGLAIAIPAGYAGFVHARSGRALREGLALVDAPGLIDAGYRGEIKVIVVNLDPTDVIHIAAWREDRPAGRATRRTGRAGRSRGVAGLRAWRRRLRQHR